MVFIQSSIASESDVTSNSSSERHCDEYEDRGAGSAGVYAGYARNLLRETAESSDGPVPRSWTNSTSSSASSENKPHHTERPSSVKESESRASASEVALSTVVGPSSTTELNAASCSSSDFGYVPGLEERGLGSDDSAQSQPYNTFTAHERGTCRPCQFYQVRAAGCRLGDHCKFCHFCPVDVAKAERRRVKYEDRRKRRQKGRAPASREQIRHD